MNQKQKNQVTTYLGYLQEELKLQHWKIKAKFVPAIGEDIRAEVTIQDNSFNATIKIPEGFLEETPEEQAITLIHEMLHILQNTSWQHLLEKKGNHQAPHHGGGEVHRSNGHYSIREAEKVSTQG